MSGEDQKRDDDFKKKVLTHLLLILFVATPLAFAIEYGIIDAAFVVPILVFISISVDSGMS